MRTILPSNKRLILSLVSVLGLLFLLCGCAKVREIKHSFSVFEDKCTVLTFEIDHQSGELSVSVCGEAGNIVYEGNTFPDQTFTVNIREAGRYNITAKEKHFVGSYRILCGDTELICGGETHQQEVKIRLLGKNQQWILK